MKKIIYRTIEKQDYPQICKMICTAFGLSSYVSDSKTLELVNKQYLCSCLAEQTYSYVAEIDGQIVGVIMGASKHATHTATTVISTLQYIFYTLQIMLFHRKACCGKGNTHQAYEALLHDRKELYDGVLTLFIVQKNYRGQGIGKALLRGLQMYWKAQGTNRSYLYTDNTCNYGFYEHMGFTRADERTVDIIRNGQKDTMDVYLYDYQANTVQQNQLE